MHFSVEGPWLESISVICVALSTVNSMFQRMIDVSAFYHPMSY